MKLRHFAGTLLFLISSVAMGVEADLNVSNDAARLTMEFPVRNNVLIDGSWLHHTDKGETLSVGGYLTGNAAGGNTPLKAGLGLRYYYVDFDTGQKEDGSNLALGGFARYQFRRIDRVAVWGNLFYAPSVLSFGDSDEFYEVGGYGGYSVIRDAEIYLGWRRMKSDFDEDGDVMVDTGWVIGIRARF